MSWDEQFEELFDALPAGSREEIADTMGVSIPTVDVILGRIRRPEIAKEQEWTVPHVPRGTGDHLFQAVLVDEDTPLDQEAQNHILKGAASTTQHIATMGENEAHALRVAARNIENVARARKVRRFATALEGAAAMAPEVADVLAEVLNGEV
jgi:hypothetical protein